MVQWLRFSASTEGVHSLVGELRSPQGAVKKKKGTKIMKLKNLHTNIHKKKHTYITFGPAIPPLRINSTKSQTKIKM